MDDQPRTDILKLCIAVRRPAISSLVAGLCFLGACQTEGPGLPPDLPAVGGQLTVIRVPRKGGTVEAYDAANLAEPIWTSRSPLSKIRDVLGVNLEARLLIAVDTTKALVGVDLESRGIRPIATGVEEAVMVPSGSVYVMSAKRITRYDAATPTGYRTPLPAPPQFQFGTFNDRYVAVLGTKPPKMIVWNSERQLKSEDIATGEAAATYWGDLLAIAADRQVLLYDTADPFDVQPISVSGKARHLAFSPSGHRLYVVGEGAEIVVFDRFSKERLTSIPMPGVPVRLRTDASGRWMMARPAVGDSVWIIDLATAKLVATVETTWGMDLPAVAGRATLVSRKDADVVASDLSRANLPELGRVTGGAADLWTMTSWVPRERLGKVAAAAESALMAQDSLLTPDSTVTVTRTDQLYLQVSSSQNADWSRELAKQLSTAGYPAQVLDPTSVDEGYRVVVGPYQTRDEAEETGRKLGRPYFVLTNPKVRPR